MSPVRPAIRRWARGCREFMAIERYIGEQPDAIRRTLQAARSALRGFASTPLDQLVLVGSGSSLNALHVVMPTLCEAALYPVSALNPAVLLRHLPEVRGTPLVVILSQSGTSTTSIEIARASNERGWPTLVVTAEPASPIAQLGLTTIPLDIGDEPIGPKTKGFTGSIAACAALAEALSGRALPEFSAVKMAKLIGSARVDAQSLLSATGVPDYVAISGSERFFGVALEASLKISEIAGIASAAFETEELLHGRLHGLGPGSCGFMLVGDRGEREIAIRTKAVMAERHVRILVVNMTDEPTPHDWCKLYGNQAAPFDAIAATIPFQWLAVELALRKEMVPEDMQYPGLSRDLAIKMQVGNAAGR
jgi:fructoselysine-6-P-deglycase FrlB-like protein